MVTFREGDIFDSDCQTLVNTVNCVGAMGKGIALQFKDRLPLMYEEYKKLCNKGLMKVGNLWLYKTTGIWVLNFPTKEHWKDPSDYWFLELGLQKFLDTYKDKGITSIAFPMLGALNGGLDEKVVRKIMLSYLDNLDIKVEIWKYRKTR